MTSFTRLALLAATTLYAFGVALIGLSLGWGIAAGVSVVGAVLAFVATLEPAPPDTSDSSTSDDVAKPEPLREPALTVRTRDDIERSARRARDEE